MAKLRKNTIALTFKQDCDRFLRFRVASKAERNALNLVEIERRNKRPAIRLVQEAGWRWEIDRYEDLVAVLPDGSVAHRRGEYDTALERHRFEPTDLMKVLNRDELPAAVIEGEFVVPETVAPGLQEAHDHYGLEQTSARPDILWIRPIGTGAPLLPYRGDPTHELHIIDVKMAAEPALRHFVEVTFYALALAEALRVSGLDERFAVSAQGYIWPGSHDANEFRMHVQTAQAKGLSEPVKAALEETLKAVPYEVYLIHVRRFFAERLLPVLRQAPLEASWHVGPRCQLCNYLDFCRPMAADQDHLSQIPFLNRGQADVLRNHGVETVASAAAAVRTDEWDDIAEESHQLRADGPGILARSTALRENRVVPVEGRKTTAMPAWAGAGIFLTVHFDPGSGITFGMAARRVYFPANREPGSRPRLDEQPFVIDRAEAMTPTTERRRLIEFVGLIQRWLEEVHRDNEQHVQDGGDDWKKSSVHFYFWNPIEVKQLRRMVERHLMDPEVAEQIEALARFFPPEGALQDPNVYRSQPGTIVKDVMRSLFGLPIPHDYTLFEVANTFAPQGNFPLRPPYGFHWPLSDQIPFERAYELWSDRIFLRRYDENFPNNPARWPLYSRDELQQTLRQVLLRRLEALNRIVRRVQSDDEYRDRLLLKKEPFSLQPAPVMQVPEPARRLNIFTQLDQISHEIENRYLRSLPIEEREARFVSIRGIEPAEGPEYDEIMDRLRHNDHRYATRTLLAFRFSPTSRDARIRERDFTLALSNELNPDSHAPFDLDSTYHRSFDLEYHQAIALLEAIRIPEPHRFCRARLSHILQCEVAYLGATAAEPFLILSPNNPDLFEVASHPDIALLDLEEPMVLDPIFRDFTSEHAERVLRTVGGQPPTRRQRRRR